MNNDKVTGVILLVEDNKKILDVNSWALEDAGHKVLAAETLAEARQFLSREKPDLAVLDIMLPDGDGLEFLPELRSIYKIPVLFLTSKTEQEEIIKGLRAGSNDYITKPYKIDEFRARVESTLQWELSYRENIPKKIIKGSLSLDISEGQAYINDNVLELANIEFKLLSLGMQNENELMDFELIYTTIWKRPMVDSNIAVQSAVKRLRQKIKDTEYTIYAKRGKGYVFGRKK
jgi:DNA-binding response OmpR family regulator